MGNTFKSFRKPKSIKDLDAALNDLGEHTTDESLVGSDCSKLDQPSGLQDRTKADIITDEIRSRFFHHNPKGAVTQDQLKTIYMEMFPDGDPDNFTNDVFEHFDVNRDGILNWLEFSACICSVMVQDLEERLKVAFRIFDSDKDGCLTLKEIKNVLNVVFIESLNYHDKYRYSPNAKSDVTHERPHDDPGLTIEDIFRELDGDGDGMITEEEFCKLGGWKYVGMSKQFLITEIMKDPEFNSMVDGRFSKDKHA